MNKIFLIAISPLVGTVEQVRAVVEKVPGVAAWRYDMPTVLLVLGTTSSTAIADAIAAKFGNKGRFVVAEINGTAADGRLTAESWYMINNRQLKT